MHTQILIANPAANVVTITETNPQAIKKTVETTDATRLAPTSEGIAKAKSVASIPEGLYENNFG